MARLGRGFVPHSRRFGAIASRQVIVLPVEVGTLTAALVAPTLRITYTLLPRPLSNNFETGIADETPITEANSDDGGAGNAFGNVQAGGTGTIVFDTARSADGTRSGRFTEDGSQGAFVAWDYTSSKVYGRFYAYRTAQPAGDQWLVLFELLSGTDIALIRWGSSGKLSVFDSTLTTPDTSAADVPINEWVRVEFSLVCHPTAGSITASFFSGESATPIETVSLTNVNTGSFIEAINFGQPVAIATGSAFWIDAIRISDQPLLGSASTAMVAPTLRVSYSTFATEPNFQTVLDNANRANEDPINPTNWTIGVGGAGTQIVSNHFESANSPPSSGMAVWNTQQPADVFVAVDFAVNCPSGDVLGVSARSNDPDEKKNCYEATANGSGAVNLGYRDGTGAWNLLATGSIPGGAPRAGDAIGLICHGSSIEAWFRRGSTWMRIHQVTDTTVTSSGYVSMGFYSDANALQWDNFAAGAFVPGVSMPDVGLSTSGALVWGAATATVELVAPTLRISYTTPAATATVAGVSPALRDTYTAPSATANVIAVAPALRINYTTPSATAAVQAVAPGLSVRYPVVIPSLVSPAYVVDSAIGTSSTGTCTVTHGFTLADGDVVYLYAFSAEDALTFAATGFTQVHERNQGLGNDRKQAWFRKVITDAAGEPSSYSVTGMSDRNIVQAIQVRSADGTTPEDVTPVGNDGLDSSNPDNIDITTASGSALILIGMGWSSNNIVTFVGGAPTNYTLIEYGQRAESAAFHAYAQTAYRQVGAAGAQSIGAWTATGIGAGEDWMTSALAVRSAMVQTSAEVESVAPTTAFTFSVSTATATVAASDVGLQIVYNLPVDPATVSVEAVAPTLSLTSAISTATASVNAVAPALSLQYVTSPATATVAMPNVTLQLLSIITLTWDEPSVTVAGVNPVLSHRYVVPAATASIANVAPTTRIALSVPTATATVAMPNVGIAIVETLNLVWDVATATVASVAPVERLTYVVSVTTASVDVVDPVTRITFAVPAATASAAETPPGLSYVYDIVETNVTVAMPDVGLQILGIVTLIWDVATATVAGVAPITRFAFGVPAATVSGAGVTPATSFRYVVSSATASVSMPDVGIAIVETLDLVWDEPSVSVQVITPTLSHRFVVTTATASVALVPPGISERLVVSAANNNTQTIAPVLSVRFVVSPATVDVAGQTVLISSSGAYNVIAATINAQAVPSALSYSFAVSSATATVAGGTVGLVTDEVNLTWDTATATVEMSDVGITFTPITVIPVPGGGQLLEIFFNDLDLRVEPATLFVQMIPPMLRTYREAKRRIPFIRPIPVMREISFEERLWEIQPREQPNIVFSAQPLAHHIFKVEPQHMLLFGVEPVERKLYNFESPLWGKYRRRTEKEEFHEMLILGALD